MHVVLHAFASHAYAPQFVFVVALQLPWPSQVADDVATPFVHDAATHSFAMPFAYVEHLVRSLPSHASALHASPPPSSHAVRVPCGAPMTPEHLPGTPVTSHASHWPLHALSQQTPSTQ
jgi:hypothetical protein